MSTLLSRPNDDLYASIRQNYADLWLSNFADDKFPVGILCRQSLIEGERWVEALRLVLADLGLTGYIPDQYLPWRSEVGFWQSPTTFKPDPEDWRKSPKSNLSKAGKDICKQFQRDLRLKVKLPQGSAKPYRCLNLEVKARATTAGGSIWQYPTVKVGNVNHWDLQKFRSDFVVVIDQKTGDTRVAPADRLTRENSWNRVKSQDVCYVVPRFLFTPLGSWADYIKDSYLV